MTQFKVGDRVRHAYDQSLSGEAVEILDGPWITVRWDRLSGKYCYAPSSLELVPREIRIGDSVRVKTYGCMGKVTAGPFDGGPQFNVDGRKKTYTVLLDNGLDYWTDETDLELIKEDSVTKQEKFWVVMRSGTDAVQGRYNNEADAVLGAKQIARTHLGKTVTVLRATHAVSSNDVTVEEL